MRHLGETLVLCQHVLHSDCYFAQHVNKRLCEKVHMSALSLVYPIEALTPETQEFMDAYYAERKLLRALELL